MSKTVLVGCRLPSGLVLDGSLGQRVELNGLNTAMIAGGVGLTHVDEVEWMFLSEKYKDHSAFKANAIFSYKGSDKVADVAAIAADLTDEKTGLEGIDPNKPGKELKPEDPVKLKAELNKNQGPKAPAKKAASGKDQAAAAELAASQAS